MEGVTGFPIVPSIGAMLLKLKNLRTERFASLRYISSTGAAWPTAHIRRFRRLLPGVKIFSMYGLTECKRTSFLPPELIDEMPGSAGWAMPNSEAFVVDGNGDAVPPGETGELVVRGSNVTLHRFFEDPESGVLPWDEAWVRRLLVDLPKKLHWNAFRFCIGPVPDKWLDIADEAGLLIQNEYSCCSA